MKIFSTIPLLLICEVIFGQGIYFDENMSWEETKHKAKKENKYIFLDVFATWCLPCRQMDKEVYANEKVGKEVNSKFVSVKVQFDKTSNDKETIRRWYPVVEYMKKKYSIESLPTLLFFTPEGALIHKGVGFQNSKDFLEMIKDAIDPKRAAFYTDIENYRKGMKDYSTMLHMLKFITDLLGDKKLAGQIAKDYKENYLDSLTEERLCVKENLDFVSQYYNLVKSTDNIFHLTYYHPAKADSVLSDKGWSERIVRNVIFREEIWQKLFTDNTFKIARSTNPDWGQIYKSIMDKYSLHYAELLVPAAKPAFYKIIGDWKNFAKFRENFMRKYPPDPTLKNFFDPKSVWSLNVDAWDVFLHCNDRKVLEKALEWSELTIRLDTINPNVQYLDTKANLLYKLGRVDEAIALEEKALNITMDGGESEGSEIYREILRKMRKGKPTWDAD